MSFKIIKISQLTNEYYPLGQHGDEYGGNADQDSEVTEEINDEMEAKDMEDITPGNDNLIIDKMDQRAVDPGTILARLEQLAILAKGGYAYDLIKAAIVKIKKG